MLARAVGSARSVVSVAEEAVGATYFIVEPNREQLVELARLADAGELRPAIDSVFPLEHAGAAFARVAERGKRGKVVLRVAERLNGSNLGNPRPRRGARRGSLRLAARGEDRH